MIFYNGKDTLIKKIEGRFSPIDMNIYEVILSLTQNGSMLYKRFGVYMKDSSVAQQMVHLIKQNFNRPNTHLYDAITHLNDDRTLPQFNSWVLGTMTKDDGTTISNAEKSIILGKGCFFIKYTH